jgi:hypothetical protein
MTIKQYHKYRFWRLVDLYREAKKNIATPEGKEAFILLSVQLHIAKGRVPKRYWPFINK